MQGSLFDDLDKPNLVEQMDEARREKYEELLGSGMVKVILAVARTLPGNFTLEDLAWVCAHHPQHGDYFRTSKYKFPDNHKLHSFLYGERGLVRRGFIKRVEKGIFRMPTVEEEAELFAAEERGEDTT